MAGWRVSVLRATWHFFKFSCLGSAISSLSVAQMSLSKFFIPHSFSKPSHTAACWLGFFCFLAFSDFWKCLTGTPLPPHPMLVTLGSSSRGGWTCWGSGTTLLPSEDCVWPPLKAFSHFLRNHSASFLINEKPLLTTEKGEHHVCVWRNFPLASHGWVWTNSLSVFISSPSSGLTEVTPTSEECWDISHHNVFKVPSLVFGMSCVGINLLQPCLTLCDPLDCSPPGPLSVGFSRQVCWSGLPCPPPGDLPDPGVEPSSLMTPALAGGFSTTSAT